MELWWQSAGISLAIIGLAEIGDKSQLVCMALAARHGRVRPVVSGALTAFAILNTLAVMFGATLANWIPQVWVLAAVAVLFALFGFQSLRHSGDEDNEDGPQISGHGLFITAFMMIFLAEFGDKTQIAVAGLAGVYLPLAVWIGSTTALAIVSLIGAVAGKKVLGKLPILWIHRCGGGLFLVMSAISVWRILTLVS